jgi:threonylcarbamoyladenosine tRNA methylthiotransferase MtaB
MTGARKIRVAFHTLGCKLNFAETSTLARSFPEDEFEKVPPGKKADIFVINTCSVTDAADRKCRQAIKKFINTSPDAFIAVVGCYAQLRPQEVAAIEGVDLVLGCNEKFDVRTWIKDPLKKGVTEVHSCSVDTHENFIPSYSVGDRTRSFLKVQDGCDYACSYCTIPLARGKSRNPEISSLIEEARLITSRGVKEIVLTGVNIGDFGKSSRESFLQLLVELLNITELRRIRISSIEPNLLSDSIIELAASTGRIVPHFHIPLQSGSDRVLGLMRRRYRRDLFRERIDAIKKSIPLAGIGADIITGFPGETEADFDDMYAFLNKMEVSYLHVFTYSERPGTPAADMPGKVSTTHKEQRSRKLIGLSERKHREFMELNRGQRAEVLFEKSKQGAAITGFTGNYIRVEHPWDKKLAGEIKIAILKGITDTGKMEIEIIG